MPAAAILPAVISGGAGIASAAIQSHGANTAAQKQTQFGQQASTLLGERTNNANDVLNSYLNNALGPISPYANSGVSALDSLMNGIKGGNSELNRPMTMADFQADPGYQFRQQQGEQAIQRSAAARGSVLGGGVLKSLDRFNSGLASQEYGNAYGRFTDQQNRRFNQLFQTAGLGVGPSAQQSELYANTGSQIGRNINDLGVNQANVLTGIGNAQGAASAASGSAYGGAVQNIGNQIGQAITLRQILNSQKQNETLTY